MNQCLEGKAAVITGGGAGIGAAVGRLFCTEGAGVLLVDADADAVTQKVEQIRQQVAGARVTGFVTDIADAAQARHTVERALDECGRIDVMVNNAAMRNHAAIADADLMAWQAVVGVNLIGTANYCRAALPALRRAGRASIVNVSSCYAVTGRKGMGIYDATKAGILVLTRTLAHEEAEHSVRTNAVCPGATLTDFHVSKPLRAGTSVEALKTEVQAISLIGRWAMPEEIARPILWLASDEASFITGSALMVDGGLSIM